MITMKQSKKLKWVVGISGVALSTFVLGQFNASSKEEQFPANEQISVEEQELLALDWNNFQFDDQLDNMPVIKSDRKTKRS